MLIGASDAPGGVELDRVEPVLPSEIELGEADCIVRLVLLTVISEAGVGEIDLEAVTVFVAAER